MSQPPQPPDPYDRYRVESIEKDKREKTDWGQGAKDVEQGNLTLGAHLILLLHKILDWFQPKAAIEEIAKNLLAFKLILGILKIEDRSQDTSFLIHLSTVWHQLLDDLHKLGKADPLAKRYASFIEAIEAYPDKSEHSLGYYLMEYKGQAWLPFPFMELLQKIHLDHQKNPHESYLTRWTHEIESLISSLED